MGFAAVGFLMLSMQVHVPARTLLGSARDSDLRVAIVYSLFVGDNLVQELLICKVFLSGQTSAFLASLAVPLDASLVKVQDHFDRLAVVVSLVACSTILLGHCMCYENISMTSVFCLHSTYYCVNSACNMN